jgi:hypothetical protein
MNMFAFALVAKNYLLVINVLMTKETKALQTQILFAIGIKKPVLVLGAKENKNDSCRIN